ncbi:MAG: DUF721 domain-containing protein, partial [Nitrospinota bacterium]
GGLQRQDVLRHWERAVGPAVARMAEPVEVKGRTLYVEVRDPVWLQQLVFLSDSIRRALNDAVGRDDLDRIFLRLGDGTGNRAAPDAEPAAPSEEALQARLAAQAPDRQTTQAARAEIGDPQLREALASLLARAGMRPSVETEP